MIIPSNILRKTRFKAWLKRKTHRILFEEGKFYIVDEDLYDDFFKNLVEDEEYLVKLVFTVEHKKKKTFEEAKQKAYDLWLTTGEECHVIKIKRHYEEVVSDVLLNGHKSLYKVGGKNG